MDSLTPYLSELGVQLLGADENRLLVRLNVNSEEQWISWLEEFSSKSKTTWIVRKCFSNPKHYLFRKIYVCRFNQYKRNDLKTLGSSKKPYLLNRKCPAKLDVKILFGFRGCALSIYGNHNHKLEGAESLNNLRINQKTKNIFQQYFSLGFTPSQALYYHETKLRINDGLNALANRAINPRLVTISNLSKKWHLSLSGCTGSSRIELIEKLASNFNLKIPIHNFSLESFACCIVTPLMERIHKSINQASEIVFVDSTSDLNQNYTWTVFLCPSSVGALPLGIVISSGKSERCYAEGFQLFHNTLKDIAFFNCKAPALFMTNDNSTAKAALRAVWPQTKQLLYSYNVLQVVGRWLAPGRSKIRSNIWFLLMRAFRKIMYAPTESDLSKEKALLEKLCKQTNSTKFLKYLERWFEMKKEWCYCFRENPIISAHNSNDCCEVTIRIMNDFLFNRCKAGNASQLVAFSLDIFLPYFKNKILNAVLDDERVESFEKLPFSIDHIVEADHLNKRFKVKSDKKNGPVYDVDLPVGRCTCFTGCYVKLCKHQKGILMHYNLRPNNFRLATSSDKHFFAAIANGEKAPPLSFFESPILCDSIEQSSFSPLGFSFNNDSAAKLQSNSLETQAEDNIETCDELLIGACEEIRAKLSEIFCSNETFAALTQFRTTISSFRSPDQILTALHSFGQNVLPKSIAERKHCKPMFFSRHRRLPIQGAATFGKDRTFSQERKKTRRQRKLLLKILKNLLQASNGNDGQ